MWSKPVPLRTTERLVSAPAMRWEPHDMLHIRVRVETTNDRILGPRYYDVMVCGRKTAGGRHVGGPADARRATCERCVKKYQPKRGVRWDDRS